MNLIPTAHALRGWDATGPARLEVFTASEFAAIEPVWREFEGRAVGHVFQTFDWMEPWCRHVASARRIEPRVVIGRSPNRILFLLPFGIRRSHGLCILEWLGGEHADYHGGLFDRTFLEMLSIDPGAFSDFFARVVKSVGKVDLVHLIRQPATLEGLPNPFLALPSHRNANRAHATTLTPNWEDYYAAKRSNSWRRTDRKHERRLAKLGTVEITIAHDAETADRLFGILADQKRHRLESMGVPDMFALPGVEAFYRELAHRSLPRGPAEICALTCGAQAAAVNYGLVHRGTFYYVLSSYDPGALAEHSPGRQLMYFLMQQSFERGLSTFDFTVGDEAYKDEWCEIVLELWNTTVPFTLRGALLGHLYRLREIAKRHIKADPRLWALAVRIRRTLMGMRGGGMASRRVRA